MNESYNHVRTQGAETERNLDSFRQRVSVEEEHFRWQTEKVTLIERELRSSGANGSLADVGCFTGIASLRYRATGFSYAVGFDLTPEALKLASDRGLETRRWNAGYEPCPARDHEFDTVVAGDVIEHILDTDFFLEELKRITRPGGTVIVTTPNLGFWLSRLRLLLGRPPWAIGGPSSTVSGDPKVDLNHLRITVRSEWESLFGAHGLKIEKTLGCSLLHAMGDNWSIRWRRAIDHVLKRRPTLSLILLFVLRTPDLQNKPGTANGDDGPHCYSARPTGRMGSNLTNL